MKYIISDNGGGIGNRIKGLISILRLSKELDRKPLLYWPKNVLMGCDFKELFDFNVEEINDEELNRIKEEEDFDFYRDWLDNIYVKNDYLIIQCWRFLMKKGEIRKKFAKVYPTMKGNNIDFEFERIPLGIAGNIVKDLRKLKPSKEIMERVEKFDEEEKVNEMIGIHLRRTDFNKSPDGRGNISTDDLFVERIEEIIKKNPKQKFFVCTDSPETEKDLKEKFGESIVVFPKTNWIMSSKEASKDSLTDLLLLSKTKKILGTYLSTFTEIAWWLGGCKAKVEIIGEEKIKDTEKVIKHLRKKEKGIHGLYKKIKILKHNLNNNNS